MPQPSNRLHKALANLTPPGATVRVTLTLSEHAFDSYYEQGIASGRNPDTAAEEEITQRLHKCIDHTAVTPLYFNDAERAELQKELGHPITNPAWVVRKLKELLTLKVDKIEVPLDAKLQARIRTRVFRGETYETVIKREVVQALERYVGLRP